MLDSRAREKKQQAAAERERLYASRNETLEQQLATANNRLRATPRLRTSAVIPLGDQLTASLPFEVYAEDLIEYTVIGDGIPKIKFGPFTIGGGKKAVFYATLHVDDYDVPLNQQGGRISIPGPPNKPLDARLWSNAIGYQLKCALYSTRD